MRDLYNYIIISSSKFYGKPLNFVRADSYVGEGFSSIYAVTYETAEALRQAGTTAGFKGCVWSERLWLDIDSYEAADTVQKRLEEMQYDFISYDTGNRGAHFGILRHHEPSHLLPLKDKAWVQAHFPEADTSIYTPLHLFRLPGTVHESTGRRKQIVETRSGRTLELPPLEEKEVKVNSTPTYYNESIFENQRVMSNTVPQHNGSRHPALVKVVYAMKERGDSPQFALWWISELNKMFEDQKDDSQLEQIVRSIYGSL